MAKNRVIYQSDALFTSNGVNATGSVEHAQLRRVQSANYSLSVSRQDVNQFGQLARIDSLILESPTVSIDTSYYLGDGFNEEALNFANNDWTGSFLTPQMLTSSGNNLYILTSPEGCDVDANASSTDYSVIGVGNAFVTDYSLDAAVGDLVTVNVSLEGTNMNATAGVSGSSAGFSGISGAGIDPVDGSVLADQALGIELPPATRATGTDIPTALRQGDIEIEFVNANGDTITDITNTADGAHVQSLSISIPMSRTPIERLGSQFAFARPMDFPINPTLSLSAIINETQSRALTDIIDDDEFIDHVIIKFKDSDIPDTLRAQYKLTNLKLDSESFSSSIGPNKTVDLTFSLSVGGPKDQDNNIFFSGSNTATVFQ